MACHEFGEMSYFFSPFLLYSLLYSQLSAGRAKKEPDEEKPSLMSYTSFSDLLGDLFASTLSPLNPNEQLELLGASHTGAVSNIVNRHGFTRREMEFIASQKSTMDQYTTRKQIGYTYGEELLELYRNALVRQSGFNRTQRREFQLGLYDSVQQVFQQTLIKESHRIPDEINVTFDFHSIFDSIHMN